jgi:sortase A
MGGEGMLPSSHNYNRKEMPMRKHKTVIFLTLGFLVGVCILLYPALSNFWNSKTQSHAIVNYESVLENIEPQDYSAIFEKAYAYNEKLYRTNNPLLNHNEIPGYNEALSISDDGMIGYLQIDRIGVELPVYHGTSEDVLGRGVGHLEGSSLPVGGEGTHSILSAHRGLPSSKLFTDLDRVEIGDVFRIIVLDQVLTYQVDFIKVIEPTDVSDLQIVDGKDYCTLFTCTPYGINTHRLLVRGVRIETAEEKPIIYVSNEAYRIEPLLVTPAVAAPMLLVMLIHLMIKYREPPKAKKEDVGDPTLEQKIRKENDK